MSPRGDRFRAAVTALEDYRRGRGEEVDLFSAPTSAVGNAWKAEALAAIERQHGGIESSR